MPALSINKSFGMIPLDLRLPLASLLDLHNPCFGSTCAIPNREFINQLVIPEYS